MNFLFDNNLPPALASAIAALSEGEQGVQSVVHLIDLFEPGADDLVWIPGLQKLGGDCYVVSQDKFKKSRGAEREALRRAGHTAYVLDQSWTSQPFYSKASQLIRWWPQVLQHARLTSGGVHRIPWRHSSAGRFQSL